MVTFSTRGVSLSTGHPGLITQQHEPFTPSLASFDSKLFVVTIPKLSWLLRSAKQPFHGRLRADHANPVASLSAALTERLGFCRERRPGVEDTGKDPVLLQLEQYAKRNALAPEYVQWFAEFAKGKFAATAGARLADFKRFATMREAALQKAFNMFDKDRDGRITVAELKYSLGHVGVRCPKTGCVYRRCRQFVRHYLDQIDMKGLSHVTFDDFRAIFMEMPNSKVQLEYWLSQSTPERCDIGCKVALKEHTAQPAETAALAVAPWGHLVAGAVAGGVSRTVTAPLETIRLAAMAGVLRDIPLPTYVSGLMQREGWRGLFKGNLLSVIRCAPQKALDFFAFDAFKRQLAGPDGQIGVLGTLGAAGAAGVTSWTVLYPLELVRSRLTVDTECRYRGITHAFQHILQHEGPAALYRGWSASVVGIIPEAAITYGLHDLLKRAYKRINNGEEAPVLTSLAFGVFAAFSGQLVSFPLETISRRLQVQCAPGSKQTISQVTTSILQAYGVAGFYRGLGATTVRLVPMAMASFGTYELVRKLLLWLDAQKEEREAEEEAMQCVPCSG